MPKGLTIGIAAAAVLLAVGGYAGERFGHPAPFPAAEQLPTAPLRPGVVEAQFFGTTTLLFRDGAHAVMVDALLSRPGMRKVLFGTVAPDPTRIRAALGQGETLDAGDFRITVFRSLHSAGDRVPGTIAAPLHPPAKAGAYKEGGTYAYLIEHRGLRILVHASANFIPGMYRGVHADMVFLATGGLGAQSDGFARGYWHEVIEQTDAKLVVPIHWDDFLRPLDRPMLPLRRFMDDIPRGMARIEPLARRDGVTIRTMPVIAPVDLAAAVRNPQEK